MSSLASNFLRLTFLRLLALFSSSASVPGCCCLRRSTTKLLNGGREGGEFRQLEIGWISWKAKVEVETKKNERYVRDVIRIRNSAISIAWGGERKASDCCTTATRSTERALESWQKAALPLKHFYTISDCFHIWFYWRSPDSAEFTPRQLTGKRSGGTLSSGRCNVMPFGSSEKLFSSSPSVVYSNNCDNAAHWTSIDGLSDRSSPN